MQKKWTSEEIELLNKYVSEKSYTYEYIGKLLNRSKASVHNKVSTLKIKDRQDMPVLCEKVVEEICKSKDKKEVCKELGITVTMFNKQIRKYPDIVHKWNEFLEKDTSLFLCYRCGQLKDITYIYNREIVGVYIYKICKGCRSSQDKKFRAGIKGKLRSLLSRCKYRDKDSDLDIMYLLELYNNQNGKCYYSGLELKYNSMIKGDFNSLSIDRKDSSKGYLKNNIVLCCWGVNRMKSDLSYHKFIDTCKLIINESNSSNIEYTYTDCGF